MRMNLDYVLAAHHVVTMMTKLRRGFAFYYSAVVC